MQLNENKNDAFEYVNEHSRKPKKSISPVLLGILLIAAGAAAGYYFIYLKLLVAMSEGSADITYSVKATMLCPVAIVFGLYYLLIRPKDLNARTGSDRNWMFVFIGIMVIACVGLYWWLKNYATAHHYFFN